MGLHHGPAAMVAAFVRLAFFVASSLALGAFASGVRAADLPPTVARIPFVVASEPDAPASMVAGVFLPPGDGPFPVLIYSHGRSSMEADRARTSFPDPRGHIRYWEQGLRRRRADSPGVRSHGRPGRGGLRRSLRHLRQLLG